MEYIYAFSLEELVLTSPLGLSRDHDVISIYVYFFFTWNVCRITYYMFSMELVGFHQGPSNTFYPQILNILTYIIVILYILIHSKNLSPILHFIMSKMSHYDSLVDSYIH